MQSWTLLPASHLCLRTLPVSQAGSQAVGGGLRARQAVEQAQLQSGGGSSGDERRVPGSTAGNSRGLPISQAGCQPPRSSPWLRRPSE